MMDLDVLVPTYGRQDLLARTLRRLLDVDVPAGLSLRITVVDNLAGRHAGSSGTWRAPAWTTG